MFTLIEKEKILILHMNKDTKFGNNYVVYAVDYKIKSLTIQQIKIMISITTNIVIFGAYQRNKYIILDTKYMYICRGRRV